MKSIKFTQGFRKRRKETLRPLGYREKCSINGNVVTISTAMKLYPMELFDLVKNGKLEIGRPIYQNLLDIVKRLDRPNYEEHRKPYKAPFVCKVSTKYNCEVDFVVRHVLQHEKFDKLILQAAPGKPKIYRSLKTEPTNNFDDSTVTIIVKRKSNVFEVQEDQ